MPLKNYGVLKGKIITKRRALKSNPHYQIHVQDATGKNFRIAVNVKSKAYPSEVMYYLNDNFQHEVIRKIQAANLPSGFTEIVPGPGGLALDFIRYNLFQTDELVPLPFEVEGTNNDLNDYLDFFVQKANRNENAHIYVFGEQWGPEPTKKDKVFGFLPGRGVHDIHMNQGSVGSFKKYNGIWQDGGMLIHFTDTNKWFAFFTAFQSQSFYTDVNGHAIEGQTDGGTSTGGAGEDTQPVTITSDIKIIAALVNVKGKEQGAEKVYIINCSPNEILIKNWRIEDKIKQKEIINHSVLQAQEVLTITLSGKGAQLGNKGGLITLLNESGIKIDGVAYTKEQAKKEGYLIKF